MKEELKTGELLEAAREARRRLVMGTGTWVVFVYAQMPVQKVGNAESRKVDIKVF